MNPPPQQHCGHEGWCWHQILGCIPLEDGKPRCVREECRGDTRSLPHTPAPAAEFTDAENKWCDDYAAAYNRGFDAGAKIERERFAKGLIEYSNRMGIYNCEEAVGDYLESLRGTQQQAGRK